MADPLLGPVGPRPAAIASPAGRWVREPTPSPSPAATERSPRWPRSPWNFDRPFLCVPAGARNHFARVLAWTRSDPLAALRAVSGPEVRVDAAFVGERLFFNSVSVGAYADGEADPRYRAHKLDTSRVVVRRLVRVSGKPSASPSATREAGWSRACGCCRYRTTATSSSASAGALRILLPPSMPPPAGEHLRPVARAQWARDVRQAQSAWMEDECGRSDRTVRQGVEHL
jgi:hypothetical protein